MYEITSKREWDEKELVSTYKFHTETKDDVEKQMKTFSEFSFKSHDSIFLSCLNM